MEAEPTMQSSPLSRLRHLAQRPQIQKPQEAPEQCELCAAPIADEHAHLMEIGSRKLLCACDACAVLFDGNEKQHYRRVPRRITRLSNLQIVDALWEDLSIPIRLAFFYRSTETGHVIAMYPSPAGATESLLSIDSWDQLEAQCPELQNMQSDVEALLVNHVGARRDCFIVSIDHCYKLVGLIRSTWRGFTGGQAAKDAMTQFFDELNLRCDRKGGRAHG